MSDNYILVVNTPVAGMLRLRGQLSHFELTVTDGNGTVFDTLDNTGLAIDLDLNGLSGMGTRFIQVKNLTDPNFFYSNMIIE